MEPCPFSIVSYHRLPERNLLDKLWAGSLPPWEVLQLGCAGELATWGAAVEDERQVRPGVMLGKNGEEVSR